LEAGKSSEIYGVLAGNAKPIVDNLEGCIRMWCKAAGADLDVAGFVLVLALTSYHFSSPGGVEGIATIIAELVVAMFMLGRIQKVLPYVGGLFEELIRDRLR
jgi:hypothetical protein